MKRLNAEIWWHSTLTIRSSMITRISSFAISSKETKFPMKWNFCIRALAGYRTCGQFSNWSMPMASDGTKFSQQLKLFPKWMAWQTWFDDCTKPKIPTSLLWVIQIRNSSIIGADTMALPIMWRTFSRIRRNSMRAMGWISNHIIIRRRAHWARWIYAKAASWKTMCRSSRNRMGWGTNRSFMSAMATMISVQFCDLPKMTWAALEVAIVWKKSYNHWQTEIVGRQGTGQMQETEIPRLWTHRWTQRYSCGTMATNLPNWF